MDNAQLLLDHAFSSKVKHRFMKDLRDYCPYFPGLTETKAIDVSVYVDGDRAIVTTAGQTVATYERRKNRIYLIHPLKT